MQLKSAFITLCSAALTFSLLISEPLKAQTNLQLPDLGTSALQALPIEKEKAIGEVMTMQIRGSSPLINDPVLDEYLTTLGRKLVANANDVRFAQESPEGWLTRSLSGFEALVSDVVEKSISGRCTARTNKGVMEKKVDWGL